MFPTYLSEDLPTLTKKRRNSISEKLGPLGFTFGHELLIEPKSWITTGSNGVANHFGIGTFVTMHGNLEVHSGSMRKNQWDAIVNYGFYAHAQIMGAKLNKKNSDQKYIPVVSILWEATKHHWITVDRQRASEEKTESPKVVSPSTSTETTTSAGATGSKQDIVVVPTDFEPPEADDMVKGPGQVWITKSYMSELLRKGCGWCGDPLFFKHTPFLGWVNGDTPICSNCFNSQDFHDAYLDPNAERPTEVVRKKGVLM